MEDIIIVAGKGKRALKDHFVYEKGNTKILNIVQYNTIFANLIISTKKRPK